MKPFTKTLTLALTLGAFASPSDAATRVRATELNPQLWTSFVEGEHQDLDVEFRQGDRLPLSVKVSGDFFETQGDSQTQLVINKDFFLRVHDDTVLVSLDGNTFRPVGEMATGNFKVSLTSEELGGPANGVGVSMEAFVK